MWCWCFIFIIVIICFINCVVIWVVVDVSAVVYDECVGGGNVVMGIWFWAV